MTEISKEYISSLFSPVPVDANKGSRGHQLNICGSFTMPGAAVICAMAGIRSGSGLVKVTTPDMAYPIIASHLIQPIFNPVASNEYGTFSANSVYAIEKDLQWSDSVVVGCGMGCNDDTTKITEYVLKNSNSPIILDADGINSIIKRIDILKEVKAPVVLTPHPGEMARCVSSTVSYVQENRISVAKDFAKKYGVIVLLKGCRTVVTDGERVLINPTGNPSMAMGGTGDMLSGMIGSFVAQGMNAFDAACAGAYIHGLCGERVANEISVRGATVEDMMDQLGALMSEFD